MPSKMVKNEIKACMVAYGWSLTKVLYVINLQHPNYIIKG